MHPFNKYVEYVPDKRRDLLLLRPLCQLAEPLLHRPDGRVDDLQKQLPGARVEDEDRAVHGLGRQIEAVRADHRLPVVRHQTDQRRVPLVGDLREGRLPARHQNLPHPVLVSLHAL